MALSRSRCGRRSRDALYEDIYRPRRTGRKLAYSMAAVGRRLRDTALVGRADVVLLYREAFPFGPPVVEALLARQIPLVYDFDDAIYLPTTSSDNPRLGPFKRPEKVQTIIRGATQTIVGNDKLAAYARVHSPTVDVIPTTLDVERYQPPRCRRRRGGKVRLGWSGSRTTAPHLESVADVLRSTIDAHKGVELTVIGAPTFSVTGESVSVRPWDPRAEIVDVSSFDIGLMPLPDEEFTRAKCGFKALLYMSLGVPCIASPVGVNSEIIQHGQNGLLASSDQEWQDALSLLINDSELRRTLGDAGRQTVVERYSGQRWAPRFLELLERAAG